MATVYLAEDLRHERKVAFKVLKPELAAVVGAERFLAEIKTTANLQQGITDAFVFQVGWEIELCGGGRVGVCPGGGNLLLLRDAEGRLRDMAPTGRYG